MAEAVGRAIAEPAPPGGPGRHRHRQVAGLPDPGRPVRRAGGGGHRHQGPAGPAGQQRPAPGGRGRRRRLLLRRAQGTEQLPLPPAGLRDRGPGRAARRLPAGSADPPDADDPLTPTAGRDDEPSGPDDPAEAGRLGEQVRRLVRWADDTTTGDRAELDFEPHFRAWAMVSTTARECPGAFRCPSGRECFAEDARATGGRGRRGGGQHPPVRGPPGQRRCRPPSPPGGGVRRGPRGRGGDDRQPRGGDRTRPVPGPGRHRPAAARSRRPPGRLDAVDAVAEVGDLLHRALRPLAGRRVPRRDLVGAEAVGPTR